MKKMGQLMSELGFRENAPESVKKAFLENLNRVLAEQRRALADQKAQNPSLQEMPECPVVQAVLNPPQQLSLFETIASAKPQRKSRVG